MQIGVAYAESNQNVWLQLEIEENATIQEAIEKSGILEKFPHIDLNKQKVGIFGKISTLKSKLNEGDRVEIYRPITADPEKVPRRSITTAKN